MIFSIIGYMIIGGIINQYGMPCITNYLLSDNTSNIDDRYNDYCMKCQKQSNSNFIHCHNCNTCHHEYSFRKCNLCDECIKINDFNKHTKYMCLANFNN